MESLLEQYARIVGNEVVDHLRQLAEPLKGMKILHVNSTKEGGGVAEILNRLIPLKQELGIDAEWDLSRGQTVKGMKNPAIGPFPPDRVVDLLGRPVKAHLKIKHLHQPKKKLKKKIKLRN